MKKPKHTNAIFNFDTNVSKMLNDASAFYIAISTAPGNTYVSILPATIAAAKSRVTTALAAETTAATHATGTVQARDLAVKAVITDIQNFEAIVQTAVNNAPDELTAIAIVHECGLHTRKIAITTKGDFDVENDKTTNGVVDVIFKAADRGVHACYELQVSDDGINYVTVKVSPDSRYKYTHGKPAGTKLWFRGRISLSDTKGGAQLWLTPAVDFIFVL
jgi:hypothetical protein